MLLELLGLAPVWTLQNEGGSTAVDFDVFLDMDFAGQNAVAHEPIEQGGFASYNKQDTPKEITVNLACTKMYFSQQPVLENIDKLAQGTQKLSLVTPSSEYKNLNLEGYSYRRTDDSGPGMLVVELKLIEIREVEVKKKTTASESPKSSNSKPIEKSKNPSNDSKAKTGRTQTKKPASQSTSALYDRLGKL